MAKLAGRANMLAVRRAHPAMLQRRYQLAFDPGPAVADPAAGAFPRAGSAAELDRFHALRVANIAKN